MSVTNSASPILSALSEVPSTPLHDQCFVEDDDAALSDEDNETISRCFENIYSGRAESIWGRCERHSSLYYLVRNQMPPFFDCYFEPFLGKGRSLLASCYDRGWKRAVLGDHDSRRIAIYETLPFAETAILERLATLPEPTLKDRPPYMFSIDQDDVDVIASIARTHAWHDTKAHLDTKARRTFAVTVRDLEARRVTSCAEVLREYSGLTFLCADFEETLSAANPGDFVYLDVPTSFTPVGHERVVACCQNLTARGVKWVATLPVSEGVAELYKGYQLRDVKGPLPKAKPTKSKKRSRSELIVVPQRPIVARLIVGTRLAD